MRNAILSVVLVMLTFVPITPTRAQESCRFVLGFATLRDLVGPQKVGNCLEDEHFNLENGNAEQRTSGGLLVWRKIDNFTAFTDGGMTWVNGPNGLQSRPNSERFSWEKDPVQPGASTPGTPSSDRSPSPPIATPISTPRTTTPPVAPVAAPRPPTATPVPDPPRNAGACCRTCTTGKACGDSCISRSLTCRVGAGCACNGQVVPSEAVPMTAEEIIEEARVLTELNADAAPCDVPETDVLANDTEAR